MTKEQITRLEEHLRAPSGDFKGARDVAFMLQGLHVDRLLAERERLLKALQEIGAPNNYDHCGYIARAAIAFAEESA